ncbi:unnamed protein product [Rotaria sp. Silwood2]|nr:unnamed protein product [Rotaria sp. Silwood2]CAF4216791.1 unnamed protein product [Rotaria sp. Silwood2]
MNQHNTTSLSVTNNSHEINRIKDHRIISEAFLLKVSECIKIANTIRTDYGIDILETNGSFEITDKVINHLDSLLSTYYQNVNQNNNNNNNNMDSTLNLSEQNDEFQKLNLFYNYSSSVTLLNNDNQIIKTEQFASDIHCIPIKLPAIIEMQLRNNQLLRNTIHNYRRHERYLNLSKKKKISAIKTADEEDILMIEAKPLCLIELNDTFDSSSIILSKTKESLTKLMNQIHNQYKNKSHKKSNNLIANIEPALKFIINEEITYEYLQNEIKINNQQNQSKQLRKKKKNQNQTMKILPYENTYGQFYYTDQFIPIEQTMIDKIVYGVQAMAAALTNTKDIEDVLNGIVMLADQSTSPFSDQTDNKIADELMSTIQKRFLTQKQGYTTNRERVRVRMALNLILADNRLNGKTIISRSESIILSRMIRKIYLCSQVRTLCSYGDVITIINDSDYHQIRFRTYKRMSLSSDEFIEILGEMYSTFYDTIETMKYYLDADDIIDLDTNLIHSSILTSKQIDDMIKYIVREDAIRQLLKLIFDRTRNSDSNIDDEHRQFKLSLPMKLNDLYQTIKKLNAFMSTTQVMVALRKPYLLQLTKRSKIKPITVNDLRAIMSQIWLLPENFDVLISENTITSEILDDFYIDFHAREDIDERLYKICKKIQDHLNLHSCITRVVLKMIAEHFNGTKLTPFLNEFNKVPRFISIIDIFDDLITSGLISTTELLVFSKQDIIIKKSSLLKHFESISFFHKRDADLLAEITLVMREDDLIEYLTQRAMTIKEIYINSILNNDQRRNFITKNLIESTKRLSSLSIHEFIRHFNLDPNCVKIFYWMGLTDENIVKTLIEIKTFVNEYTLDGIYNNFLTRLHDTLESGVYYISTENLINYDQQKEYLTIKQRNNHHSIHQMISENFCKLGCFLTYKQAYILVDYADPEYEHELSSLTTTHDIISQERLKILLKSTNNEINFDELSKIILPKQQVIECKTLLDSFHQRINYRQNRFKRVENLQKLLLSSILIEKFLEMISDLGVEYFTHIELDCLEEIKLIDIGVLAVLLTLPSYNPLIHQHKYEWFRNKDSLIENDEQISNIPPNYLHILDPIIEKYSIFLTTIIIRIISNKERFEKVNEILLSNSDYYLSTEEVLKICAYEQILTYDNIQYICQEIFPTKQISDINDQSHHSQKLSIDMSAENIQEQSNEKSLTLNINQHDNDRKSEGINNSSVTRLDSHETSITLQSIFDCYTRNMSMYTHDSVLRHKMEQTVIITIFDYILHFNHRTMINEQLRQLFNGFKPLAFYKAQLLIEKEIIVIKLLLNIRKQQAPLTIHDLNRYLESYQIPCRLDIVNELCRIKIISQSLANDYTMNQCYELKVTTPEGQAIFLFYMMIKLIQKEGYIDEINVREILNQYQTKNENEKFNIIYKYILRNGFLTIEQLIQSAKDFFLQDYLNEDILKNQSSEYKTVIQEQFLTNILHRKQLTNTQFELALSQNMRRRQVIQTNILSDQIKNTKIAKEKVQRKVDHVLLKKDDNTQSYSKSTPISSHLTYNSLVKQHKSILEKDQQLLTVNTNINNDLAPNLRSLRHNYIQAKIPRNQLHLLVEQGGWNHDTYLEFKRELNIIDSDNSLDLIRHITYNISLLIKENGSVTEKPLMKHFQQHSILFHADFQLLLIRYGIVALEDLIDLLIVSKLAKVDEIKSYAKTIFCLNVNKFMEISKSQENALVKKHHVQNNLEKKICITATDLSQLLNHVLKLDRLKRIIDMMATIKNYIHLHPINTFNALKALKLEFDFNNYDMKFLRDLKLLSDTWYKRYLLSQKNETDSRVSEIIDEEQEQEDQNQHKFHSSIDEDFDLDAFNELFETKELQLDISEQQKQAYFEKLKKQKTQLDSSKLKISTDEDSLQLSINLDDFHKQEEMKKDQTRVIEQFFPDASILGPQLLLPYISDDQKRLFIELDFAEEQNIEDYYKQNEREDVTQQMNKYSDITEKESTKSHIKIEEDLEKIPKSIEEQQQSILKLSSDERFSSNEIDKLSIDSQSIKTFERNEEIQQTVEQSSIEKRLSQIKTSDLIPTEEDKTKLIGD